MKLLTRLSLLISGVLISTLSHAHNIRGQEHEGTGIAEVIHFMTSPDHLLITTLCGFVIATIIVVQKRRANKKNLWVIQTKEKRLF